MLTEPSPSSIKIDTHLHVRAIVQSSLYQNADGSTMGTSAALGVMRDNFASSTHGTSHFSNVDLHHALLGGGGGGIAYIGVLCNSDYGFGLVSTRMPFVLLDSTSFSIHSVLSPVTDCWYSG